LGGLVSTAVLPQGGRGGAAVGSRGEQPAGGRVPTIDERTAGMQKLDGYFPVYWDERGGALFLEIPRFDADFMLSTGLGAGLGSNDIGLDRGQGGQGRIVRFERIGPKVLLTQSNESFRSSSSNAAGGRGGGGGPQQGPPPIGEAGGRGAGGGRGGGLFSGTVASVTPSAEAVTMREHVSLVELPDSSYKSRWDDPRAGYGGLTFVDYSVPIGEPMQMHYIRRHRLDKKDA